MPLPVITNVMRVAVRGRCPNGQPWINVMHFNRPGSNNVPDDAALIHAEINKLYSVAGYGTGKVGWASNASNQGLCLDATYTALDGVSAAHTLPANHPGNVGGDALPSDTAVVVTHRTGLRGRSFRGRTYWAGFAESLCQSNGSIGTPTINDYLACWAAFQAALTAKQCQHVVASYKLASATVVQSYSIDSVFDRQRRRKA